MLLLLHHFNGANIRPFANGANIFCKKLTFLFKLFFSRLFFRCLQKKYRNYISAFFRILFYINYNKLLIASTYVCFGATPTWRPTTSPFWKINTVGMLRTPYCDAKSWFASTSTLPTTTFPSKSLDNSSIVGPNILHGPHHSAQKSTTTGLSDFNTTSSNVASVISKAISFVFFNVYTNLGIFLFVTKQDV